MLDHYHLPPSQCLFDSSGEGRLGGHVQLGFAGQSQLVCQYSQLYRYLAHLVLTLVRCQKRSMIGCAGASSIDF